MTATHANFLLFSGDTWVIDAALHDNANAALDLTDAEIVWRLRNAAQTVVAELTVDNGIEVTNAAGGLCRITVTPVQSAALPEGNYSDEIVVTTAEGLVTTQAVGAITVMRAGAEAAGPDLHAELAALKAARRSGERRVRIENFEREFKSDSEMAAAIAATEAEIAGAQGAPRRVTIRTSKGW